MKQRWSYDVPVNGVHEKFIPMEELMRAYKSCRDNDVDTALAILEYACDCQHVPAKLELARLLINNPKVNLGQSERYEKAEQLLMEFTNELGTSNTLMACVSLELANLYSILNRPVGMLAMLLRARRFGSSFVPDKDIELCRRKLSKMDINTYGSNAKDAYSLGMELIYAKGPFKFAEFLLREAVDAAEGELKGRACLSLADLYAWNPQEGRLLCEESFKLYKEASKNGCAEYISRSEILTLKGEQHHRAS